MCYYYSIAFLLCPASIRSPRSILLQNYLAIEGRLSIYSRSNPFFRFVFFPFLVPFEHFTVLELSIVQSSQTTHTHHYAFLFHPIFILPLHQNSFANINVTRTHYSIPSFFSKTVDGLHAIDGCTSTLVAVLIRRGTAAQERDHGPRLPPLVR